MVGRAVLSSSAFARKPLPRLNSFPLRAASTSVWFSPPMRHMIASWPIHVRTALPLSSTEAPTVRSSRYPTMPMLMCTARSVNRHKDCPGKPLNSKRVP